MNALLAAILNTLWQSAALAAIVWIVLRIARTTNAATRHAIWWVVLAVIVLLPAIPGPRSTPRRIDVYSAPAAPIEMAPLPVGPRQPFAPVPQSGGPLELPAGTWTVLLFALWSAAALVQLARTAGSYVYLRRLKRDARPATPDLCRIFDGWILSCRVRRPVRLMVSSRIASPMAVGFLRPAVLLPESLLAHFEDAELDHVFLHELAHMARRDDWTNLAARIATGLLSIHPVALFALRQIDREREMSCDEWVVCMTGAVRPYATSLTRLFELCRSRNRVLLASGMATRASHLGERIEMLLRQRRQWVAKTSLVKVGFACIALIAAGLAFSQTPRLLAISQDTPPTAPAPPDAPEAVQVPEPPAAPDPDAAPEPPAAPDSPPPAETATPAETPLPRGAGLLAGLVAAGYGDLPVDDIILLKSNGISADYLIGFVRSGWGRLKPRELVELHNQGIDPEYARAVHDAGLESAALADCIKLRQHGVNANGVHMIHSLGFGPYKADDVILLQDHGVMPDFFRVLHENGWKNLSAREAVEAREAGLDAHSLQEARQYGSLTLKQVIRLKQAGVI
jgi:beta-lactamase regulating signal transducer with metallopeptidase domain